jgi:hypothetical protein
LERAEPAGQTSRETCGEIAKLCLLTRLLFEINLVCTQKHSSCPDLIRASIHLPKKLFSKKMDCRVKPGNDDLSALARPGGSQCGLKGFPVVVTRESG